ncbi:amyloid-beta A4 precursor protein-binding family A member 1 isoform X5 [Lynx canadensis]|uniref:amyloid-beta A4 precursor protein-binding family A member 1 isoform X5 n=1 Tax=Lynx canadensis TaxID=61383 RepID=UPI0011B0A71C|nr:amyloid-beta A4 precursor protein-binding family A member 1 isoform X5 [Lynx canadensis]XP_046957842.1 amyloid-beta A4 precursor protein-binding family A member 1 isoform X4 [Lynx rufus]
MNHLEGSAEVEVTDEAAGGEVNESVEADLEHPEVEEQQQRYAGRPGRGRAVEDPRAPPGQQEEEERGECLARSASTESGFHNHTDTAEGDVIAAARDGYDAERAQDPEDESAYAVQYRPEAEEYTEQAEAEHAEATHRRALPNHLHFHSLEHEEAMNAAYSGYVYTHRLFHRGEDEPYAEPYADYGGLQEHVYEEIGDAPELEARDGLRLYEQERDEAAAYRQEALGARLHHYDERSDGESDSPEKEAEFAPYPRMDSYEQEEDIDQIVAEVKQSMSSQSLDKAAEDMPEAEQDLERAPTPGGGRPDSPELQALAGQQRAAGTAGGEAGQRYSKEKRDAISLAIKDIKEAIEEVKTRTIRSPYTPDEPKEPIWVMRQDISPTRDCDDQRPVDGDSPSPGSSPPLGAESSSIPLHPSDPAEASSNKESRKSLASFPTYVEVPGPCDPEDLIDGIIFAANYLGSTQLLSDKTPSKNVRMMQAQEAVSRIKVFIEKQKGEILGVVIVESGWGSILPTVIIANMMHGGPAEKSGKLNIGDQIMSINGTSLVGLPLSTCQSIIKGLKNQPRVKLNIVRCPPVTTVLIRRPDLRYQLGFSVQNGIICSLMRGGIAERGGVRVGHRIIEINGQSVVATPHEKIVHILSNAVGEIHMKTMPAAMYRLLTAQEQPVYI